MLTLSYKYFSYQWVLPSSIADKVPKKDIEEKHVKNFARWVTTELWSATNKWEKEAKSFQF